MLDVPIPGHVPVPGSRQALCCHGNRIGHNHGDAHRRADIAC